MSSRLHLIAAMLCFTFASIPLNESVALASGSDDCYDKTPPSCDGSTYTCGDGRVCVPSTRNPAKCTCKSSIT